MQQRWIEIVHHCKQMNIEYGEILKIIQYDLALPGTNTPAEHVFPHKQFVD